MGDLLSDFGDLMFSLVIGYIGAVEFLYVVRHLYHWTCNHDGTDAISDTDSLAHLQENMREQLAAAKATEDAAGKKAMKDGVLYEDGFRIDPNQADIDNLKEQLNKKAERDLKRADLEKELDKQKQIAEQTRKELQEAEAEVARQQREAEENERKIREAELQREREQKRREEEEKRLAEERERKQKQEEEEQQKRIAEEQERKRKQEEEDRRRQEEEAEENTRRLLEAERLKEEQQRQAEEQAEHEENERRLLEAEREMEEKQRLAEEMLDSEELTDNERQLIASIRERDIAEQHDEASAQKEAELLQRILKAREQLGEESEEEQSQRLFSHERDRELKQKRIEENARLFLEAEKEMANLKELMQEAVQKKEFASSLDSAPQTPAIEEPCIKKTVYPLQTDEAPVAHRVKTQLAQNSDDSYSISTKSLLFPGISDDASSNDPPSSKQSSFSTQPSDEITTSNESQYLQQERQEPDGEDTTISQQYSDDYLRSLDGIKSRPLSREDRSGRRIAFKKRRSSGSSNSSRESRTSRDEELKMFTSLEEEEMKDGGDAQFTPIRYTSEPTLKVKGHHRRHKRSPAKDMRSGDDSLRSSLERLGEETINPWGDVVPEHYKDTEFWKREKAISIEEERDVEKPTSSEELNYDTATNLPSASSFEEATQIQNEEALKNLRKQDSNKESKEEELATKEDTARSDNNANLQTSTATEKESSPSRSSSSPRLRRSPRIEEMDQYEERWKESNEPSSSSAGPSSTMNTPSITVDKPLDFGTWRDEHGLIMEGLSDFYDFTASVNPSRSRSTSRNPSRNPSPANTAPNTPQPKNVSFEAKSAETKVESPTTPNTQKALDGGPWRDEHGLLKEGLSDFYDFQASVNPSRSRSTSRNPSPANTAPSTPEPKNVSCEINEMLNNETSANSIVDIYDDTGEDLDANEFTKENIGKFLDSLNSENENSTANGDNFSPSEENDKFLQNRLEHVADDQSTGIRSANFALPLVNVIDDSSQMDPIESPTAFENDEMNNLVANLRAQRSRSRSRSKSPLPTSDNIQRSLETRRHKLIKHNEDVLEKLIESKLLPESPEPDVEVEDFSKESMSLLVESLRSERSRSHSQTLGVDLQSHRSRSQSRSRSKSPLPTAENIQRSLETRRNKLIQHNEEIFDKLVESNLLPLNDDPVVPSPQDDDEDCSRESVNLLVETLRVERSRSRSRSCSPMPSTENIELRLKDNDGLNEKFAQETQSSGIPPPFNAPLVSIESVAPDSQDTNDDDCSREAVSLLVQSLRAERSRSRSRCRSPIPSSEHIEQRVKDNEDDINERFSQQMQSSGIPAAFTAPLVSIEVTEPDREPFTKVEEEECSREQMDSLVQSLRVARSRSRSKSPMRLPTAANLSKSLEVRRSKLIEINDNIKQDLEERARTPEPPQLTVEYVYEFVENSEETSESSKRCRLSRSRTPSRSPETQDGTPFSRNPSRSASPSQDSDFHVMLNLEGSLNRTLTKNTEVYETSLAQRQKQLDVEALETLKYASEEIELRTLSPLSLSPRESNEGNAQDEEEEENKDLLTGLPMAERHKMLRKSPTTPDYDRTISEEMRDVDRIKQERLQKGFIRSTYVGESMDLVGTEYETMRRDAERFRRSRSPTPSFSESPVEPGQMSAAERRQIQDMVLAELTGSSDPVRNTGAIPKIQGSMSVEGGTSMELEDMRRRNAEFQRSASRSRSPLGETELADLAAIEEESTKRKLKDRALDEICNINNFQEFSRHLNPHYLDEDRRASDSALITKPDILIQWQDSDYADLEPEEYHHYRRFSLAQEQQVEEYPSDDYIFIQQIEVRTRSGSRTWTREDFYSEDSSDFVIKESSEDLETEPEVLEEGEEDNDEGEVDVDMDVVEAEAEENDNSEVADELIEPYEADGDDDDEEESNGSDDRRTVIEVDDEIDEDISDFNERGPAEESHHEQSECEEAEREMDRYAGREARDWDQVVNGNELFASEQEDSEGAVGGGASSSPYDSDSFAIDQIYDEAIRNRKQSGILREFDSLLNEMSSSSIENSVRDMEEQYALWSKTHKKTKNLEFSASFLESERKDTEMRYLGDANTSARQSTRLRSRYGYNPVLQASTIPDDIEVDLNYKPKREYNWRKNFRLSDEEPHNEANENETNGDTLDNQQQQQQQQSEWDFDKEEKATETQEAVEKRRFSLGGESVTLFSQSPERLPPPQEQEEDDELNTKAESVENVIEVNHSVQEAIVDEELDKPKKKKTKKKTRKGSKGSVDILNRIDDDNDDYEPPIYSRRSSSIQMETDSPKRKSRSRRSSRSSVTNDDSFGLYSPRNSVGYADPTQDIIEEYSEVSVRPKKIKKRKKVKEILNDVSEVAKEEIAISNGAEPEPILDIGDTASAIITPDSASANVLSMLSPQESICVTPASLDSELSVDSNQTGNSANSTVNMAKLSTQSSVSSPVDSFDILKDANFYPLF